MTKQINIKYENKTQYHLMFLNSLRKWAAQAVHKFDELSGATPVNQSK